jgi:hypothetical protein
VAQEGNSGACPWAPSSHGSGSVPWFKTAAWPPP